MTQDNILVSPTVSACLKPGSLCRSSSTVAPQTSPRLRPAEPGDTFERHDLGGSNLVYPRPSSTRGALPPSLSVLELGISLVFGIWFLVIPVLPYRPKNAFPPALYLVVPRIQIFLSVPSVPPSLCVLCATFSNPQPITNPL
jgi:hypothetical protein